MAECEFRGNCIKCVEGMNLEEIVLTELGV